MTCDIGLAQTHNQEEFYGSVKSERKIQMKSKGQHTLPKASVVCMLPGSM